MKVLFICRSNAGRSQVAAAYFERLTKKNTCKSAGVDTKAENMVGKSPGSLSILTLKKEGIDISRRRRKQVTLKMLGEADKVVILMTEKERRKFLPRYFDAFADKTVLWSVVDMRHTRSVNIILKRNGQIKRLAESLVSEIG